MSEERFEEGIASSIFQLPLPFDLSDPQTRGARWEKCITGFEHDLRATCKNHKDENVKDLFLNLVGDDVEDLLVMFPPESIMTYKGLVNFFTDCFDLQRNVDYERYTFNTACQRADEFLHDFAIRLRKLVTFFECDKFNNNEAIWLRITKGCY
ncbi:hypothetical protein NDU88_001931 [Pleurodeles waltl]|uniref:Uncharacterized protein n=1 Tax=Pleurodeles waltl TaxID=8319 RepID=A0AAV7U9B6_PLEWA|nr:hypothetical protein NDU88_001931 [Pleurodeles waltl]